MKGSGKQNRRMVILPRLIWLLTACLLVFFALNRHSKADRFNYHSEIWADKAGYSIYLQAFEYDYDGRNIPDSSITAKTGLGFEIVPENGVILTKYTYGTALAQLPFYLLGSLLESDSESLPGFSVIQNRMVSVAGAIYLCLGLFFLYRFLRHYYDKKLVVLSVLVLLFGTNLLYYGTFETGMSHVYSFALFSALLWWIKSRNFFHRERFGEFFIFGCLAGWIVVTRQSNLLFPLVFFFLDATSWTSIRERIFRFFKFRNWAPAILGFSLLIAPQIVYWNYAFESMLAYSYGDEGFHWLNPRIIKVLFDPYNGFFLYSPVMLALPVYLWIMIRKKIPNGWMIAGFFVLMTYVFSCWWAWWFGCAFGARSYVEYLSVFSLVIAFGWKDLLGRSKRTIVAVCILLILACGYTTKMALSIDTCFPGHHYWDWSTYLKELKKNVN